jgi:hypothetical protein
VGTFGVGERVTFDETSPITCERKVEGVDVNLCPYRKRAKTGNPVCSNFTTVMKDDFP